MLKAKINFNLMKSFALGLIAVLLLVISISAKAESTIFLDKNGATVNNGQNFSVKVLLNSDGAYNTAQVNLSFDSEKLKLTSVSGGSALPKFVDQQQLSSSIKYTMYGSPGTDAKPGKNIVLLIVNFKAISTGAAKVKLESGTRTLIAGKTVASGLGSSTINVKTSPTSTSSSASSAIEPDEIQPPSSRNSTIQPQTPVDKAAEQEARKTDKTNPKFIKISQSGFIDDNISIKITTDEPTRASIKSGQSKNELKTESLSQGGLKGTYFVSLGSLSKSIQDQKPFYYQITITDIAGNETKSEIMSIDTTGITVSLTIKNPDGTLIRNRDVIINGKEFKTNSDGIVTIENLIPGSINVSIIDENGEEIFLGELTAVEGISDQVLGIISQKNIQDGSALELGTGPSAVVIAAVGAMAILVALVVAKKQLSKRKQAKLHTANPYPGALRNNGQQSPNYSNPTVISPSNSTSNANNSYDSDIYNQPMQSNSPTPQSTIDPATPLARPTTNNTQYQQPNVVQPAQPPDEQKTTTPIPGVEQAKTIVSNLVNDSKNKDNK